MSAAHSAVADLSSSALSLSSSSCSNSVLCNTLATLCQRCQCSLSVRQLAARWQRLYCDGRGRVMSSTAHIPSPSPSPSPSPHTLPSEAGMKPRQMYHRHCLSEAEASALLLAAHFQREKILNSKSCKPDTLSIAQLLNAAQIRLIHTSSQSLVLDSHEVCVCRVSDLCRGVQQLVSTLPHELGEEFCLGAKRFTSCTIQLLCVFRKYEHIFQRHFPTQTSNKLLFGFGWLLFLTSKGMCATFRRRGLFYMTYSNLMSSHS